MWDLGVLRDRGDFARRLAVTAVALIAYRFGAHLPLPGLDPHSLSLLDGSDGRAIERISIVAFGIYPFVSVLILAELAKLLIPPLRRWERADARNGASLNRWLVLLAIGMAVVQGTGFAREIEGVTQLVTERGVSFRIACAGTIVAGTALAIWLADLITRHGLGSGIWVLYVAPALVDLPYHASAVADRLGDGSISAANVALSLALVVLSVAALSATIQADGANPEAGARCLWPILLAMTVLPYVLVTLNAVLLGRQTQSPGFLFYGNPVRLVLLAALISGFAVLFDRSKRSVGDATRPVPIVVVIAALSAIALANDIVTLHGPTFLGTEALVGIAVIATLMIAQWWKPRRA